MTRFLLLILIAGLVQGCSLLYRSSDTEPTISPDTAADPSHPPDAAHVRKSEGGIYRDVVQIDEEIQAMPSRTPASPYRNISDEFARAISNPSCVVNQDILKQWETWTSSQRTYFVLEIIQTCSPK